MAAASGSLLVELEEKLRSAAADLPRVVSKKMFGCQALWADGNVFALVWKEGRIGLKLPEEATYQRLMACEGARPWKAGTRRMAHWVLVPEAFHSKTMELKMWVKLAHEQCSVLSNRSEK